MLDDTANLEPIMCSFSPDASPHLVPTQLLQGGCEACLQALTHTQS